MWRGHFARMPKSNLPASIMPAGSHLLVKQVSFSDSLIAGGGQNARATMAAAFCMVTA